MKIKNRYNGNVITGEGSVRAVASANKSNLRNADLSYADLRNAKLMGCDLMGCDLRNARIEFYQYPSIRLLSSMTLGTLSDDLTLELMRRDAYAHPHPKRFDEWAKGGRCPYQNEEHFWVFNLRSDLWSPGLPQMTDRDLIKAICMEKGWEIKGYLKTE